MAATPVLTWPDYDPQAAHLFARLRQSTHPRLKLSPAVKAHITMAEGGPRQRRKGHEAWQFLVSLLCRHDDELDIALGEPHALEKKLLHWLHGRLCLETPDLRLEAEQQRHHDEVKGQGRKR